MAEKADDLVKVQTNQNDRLDAFSSNLMGLEGMQALLAKRLKTIEANQVVNDALVFKVFTLELRIGKLEERLESYRH